MTPDLDARRRRILMAINILEARRETRTLARESHPEEEIRALRTMRLYEKQLDELLRLADELAIDALADGWLEASA